MMKWSHDDSLANQMSQFLFYVLHILLIKLFSASKFVHVGVRCFTIQGITLISVGKAKDASARISKGQGYINDC
jgi:hypothetical protein